MRRSWQVGAVLVALASGASCSSVKTFASEPSWPTPNEGMVVTEHPLATAAGQRILQLGGNAADAAVAAALVLAVVYPQAGNLGGGGFALWVPHEGEAASLDFREVAPSRFRKELFFDGAGDYVPERSVSTPLAVGVPGTPAGLYRLFRLYGSRNLLFEQLCLPAIELAQDGFPVDAWLTHALRSEAVRKRMSKYFASRDLFYPNDRPLAPGATLVQPQLAETLRLYQRQGAAGFYQGETARRIVRALQRADMLNDNVAGESLMSLEDLANYTVRDREPLVGWFRGYEVITMGPPSSGGLVLLEVLSTLDGFPMDADRTATLEAQAMGLAVSRDPAGISARALHWWIEAMRYAFADRAVHMGDPDFHDVPVDALLAPRTIAQRRVAIGDLAQPDVGALVPPPPPESDETTHISIVDRYGNAVSLTTTLNASFGSGILVEEAGFLLNNEIDDFSIQSGVPNMYGLVGSAANEVAPRKRPLSSMTPTVLRDGGHRVSLVLGAPGGPRIITAVIQVLLRVLVYEEELERAVAAPRLHQQWKPAATRFESGWNGELVDALVNRHLQPVAPPEDKRFGSVQALQVLLDGSVVGASDPRRGGVAGYESGAQTARSKPEDWPVER